MSEPKQYQALVEDKIFLGSASDVESMIQNEGVEVVVDLRGEAQQPAFSDPNVQWIQIALGDESNSDQGTLFKQAIDEVMKAYKNGKKVAFHCNGGRGRTGAVAAGTHLSLGLSSTLQEAEEKVKEIRSEISIKPKQKEALHKLFSE
ncbi:dual specificity protein phosphatase family protein [Brevibacillus parabrevis]|uniref:protein-tyrosine phosphatase family protein n=1 Tax=Brevibacillus parabrevis TaxID=54914 RepID=UPI0022B713AC|nr:dual specificity protein phosphatase family protein [Brevibacillus parabrevis]